ncbi:hypothetical protein B5V02_06015 [Mesorhizobium kowhaii]|uniref:UspA domain-containing protein n=1 Tax=Mesorhizobium kowhaii TaxID=1300272 RepID=A0A2W7CES0_9HYPH|nr:hypothetical protein B5V02_06015 [Mesorhizobium kowhaii]
MCCPERLHAVSPCRTRWICGNVLLIRVPLKVAGTLDDDLPKGNPADTKVCGRLALIGNVRAVVVHIEDKKPSEAILELSQAEGCDLIVMASHGRRGLGRLLLGSQTAEVLS